MNKIEEEIIEKIKRRSDESYIIVKIGDLRKIVPVLNEIIHKQELNVISDSTKLISIGTRKLVEDNEIIHLSELELRLIITALEKTNGNVKKTSQELGITERTLWRKFKEHKIDYKKYEKKVKNSKQI